MDRFLLSRKKDVVLGPFSQILEFGCTGQKRITPHSLELHYNPGIEICAIYKGKYEWESPEGRFRLYPGDAFVTCPWQKHGSPHGFLDIGRLAWIILRPGRFLRNGMFNPGSWCGLDRKEAGEVGRILAKSACRGFHDPRIGEILLEVHKEVVRPEPGRFARVNGLITDLLVLSARGMAQGGSGRRDQADELTRLEQELAHDLARKWSVPEMAALVNMGATAFYNRIKAETGHSPVNYLTTLRLKNAGRLLKETNQSITSIALDCGFCSSQHLATTFRKWQGMTPRKYRHSKL